MPQVTPQYLAQRRASILAAAARCFAANGFHATSIPDICAEAGMSAGGVYRYFAGKDELIAELGDSVMTPVLRALRTAASADPVPGPAEVIDLIHRALLTEGSSSDASLILQVWAEVVRNPGMRESLHRHVVELVDALSEFTRQWAPSENESAETAARALMAMSMGTFLMQNVLEAETQPTPTQTLLDSVSVLIRHR
ncbi:TetR/AcrR family transcriptional regulator [Nonomuraea jiangxiensis]|uniref:DNA-binding transcriptional regulator, AcrR family n=1 Tax=Nonomuraea jiangxiensis TaxID=633440 RepID=A0A1G9VGA2_9ACTN|nr:TetR/AcrR family transcriptional regulator [Nonomuraea jiangxiensis]SDM71140.1 DNA-binding transcriptional regulator, AcrR family [Nonomuraea jiangxiensis]